MTEKSKRKELLEALKTGFEDYGLTIGKNSEKILESAATLCEKHGRNSEDFVDSWLAFAATSGNELNEDNLKVFERQELSKERDKLSIDSHFSVNSYKVESKFQIYGRESANLAEQDGENDNFQSVNENVLEAYGLSTVVAMYTGTPKAEKKPGAPISLNLGKASDFSPAGYSPAIGALSVSYAARTRIGESVLWYKCTDGDYWNDVPVTREPVKITPSQCTEKVLSSGAQFKYMLQTASGTAATHNANITEIGYNMLNGDDTVKHPQDLRASSTEYCWYLGRIINDDGRLSQENACLEGDLDISGGHVVFLDLSLADEFCLVPGQVVMIKGRNELGKCLRVSEVGVPPAFPMPQIVSKSKRPLNLMVACGPYTPTDSIMYEPLKDLIEVIKKDKPDVCILIGPFIDPTHPMIVNEELADTFEDLFADIVNIIIKQPLEDFKTHVVLIPSFKDAHHHPVYPTPPYVGPKSPKISVFPDPSMFQVAGVTIGVTSTDILKHLANNEIAKTTITDRMGGLSKIVLSQRNMYPLYPPDKSVPLDVQLWRQYCKFTSTPHLLIMPSDLRYFIKDVDGAIVINPERLTKVKSGGTYARLQVKLPKTVGNENLNSIADFSYGEIIKI